MLCFGMTAAGCGGDSRTSAVPVSASAQGAAKQQVTFRIDAPTATCSAVGLLGVELHFDIYCSLEHECAAPAVT
jgi:hypothetical protein